MLNEKTTQEKNRFFFILIQGDNLKIHSMTFAHYEFPREKDIQQRTKQRLNLQATPTVISIQEWSQEQFKAYRLPETEL